MHNAGGDIGDLPSLRRIEKADFISSSGMERCDCKVSTETRKLIEELQKTCHELQHKVRSLEGAKLLWEITRMSMEFQTIKDLDETHRQRSELEDELHRTQHRARHFETEQAKLQQENKLKEERLEFLEERVKLLQDKDLMDKRIDELELQVKELDEANKEHVAREEELLQIIDQHEEERFASEKRSNRIESGRSAFVREIKQEIWTKVNPAGWIKGLRKSSSMHDVSTTYPDLELLNLLKREVPKLTMRPRFNRHSIS